MKKSFPNFKLYYTAEDNPTPVLRCYLINRLRYVLSEHFGKRCISGGQVGLPIVFKFSPSLYDTVIAPVINIFIRDYLPANFDIRVDLDALDFIVIDLVHYE